MQHASTGHRTTLGANGTLERNDLLSSQHSVDIELIIDILFIFLSGIAVIVILIVLVYAMVVLFDRYCGCVGGLGWREIQPPDDFQNSADTYGEVAYKARLWGLTSQERRAILQHALAHNTSQYAVLDGHDGMTAFSSKKHDNSHSLPEHTSKTMESPSSCRTRIDREGGSEDTKVAPTECSVISHEGSNVYKEARIRIRGNNASEETLNLEAETDGRVDTRSDSMVLDDRQLRTTTCAICLGEYEDGDKLLHGRFCSHLFHHDCILTWWERCHDNCPYCRQLLFSPSDMRKAAHQVLNKQRLEELSWGKRQPGGYVAATSAGATPDLTS